MVSLLEAAVLLLRVLQSSCYEYWPLIKIGLTSEKGLMHRSNRPIEPEAVFGQMKFNMGYKRFRHFGKDKITMDFAFFAIVFNIMIMNIKGQKQGTMPINGEQSVLFDSSYKQKTHTE